MDPNKNDKLDPDPDQSDKLGPDPDPHKFADENPKYMEYEAIWAKLNPMSQDNISKMPTRLDFPLIWSEITSDPMMLQ